MPELIEAVEEFLAGDVIDATDGRVRFHARVAMNVLAIVRRELALGPEKARRHATGLAGFGMADDGALARAIRSRTIEGRLAEVAAFVRQAVVDSLAIANPGYATGGHAID